MKCACVYEYWHFFSCFGSFSIVRIRISSRLRIQLVTILNAWHFLLWMAYYVDGDVWHYALKLLRERKIHGNEKECDWKYSWFHVNGFVSMFNTHTHQCSSHRFTMFFFFFCFFFLLFHTKEWFFEWFFFFWMFMILHYLHTFSLTTTIMIEKKKFLLGYACASTHMNLIRVIFRWKYIKKNIYLKKYVNFTDRNSVEHTVRFVFVCPFTYNENNNNISVLKCAQINAWFLR